MKLKILLPSRVVSVRGLGVLEQVQGGAKNFLNKSHYLTPQKEQATFQNTFAANFESSALSKHFLYFHT